MAVKLTCDSAHRGETAAAIQEYNFLAKIAFPIAISVEVQPVKGPPASTGHGNFLKSGGAIPAGFLTRRG